MKTYLDSFSYKLSYCRIALFLIMIVGCSSTTRITQTYSEYVPPIRPEDKACIEKISENKKNCKGRIELEKEECKGKALVNAQEKLADAQIDYQRHLADLKQQRVLEIKHQKLQILNQQNEYDACLARQKQQTTQPRNNTGGGISMIYIDTCPNPQRNIGGQVSNSWVPPEPQLEDFIQDAHCYANTECEGDYNHQYEQCGGTVLKTTRCFANCGRGE